MRNDAVGFFWDDTPPPRILKVVEKRTPPTPTWLDPSYLPYLEEALAFPVHVLTFDEICKCIEKGHQFLVDVESYGNYFLVMFTDLTSGSVYYVEEIEGVSKLDVATLIWLMERLTTVGFNSIPYDAPMIHAAITGKNTRFLKQMSSDIIRFDILS